MGLSGRKYEANPWKKRYPCIKEGSNRPNFVEQNAPFSHPARGLVFRRRHENCLLLVFAAAGFALFSNSSPQWTPPVAASAKRRAAVSRSRRSFCHRSLETSVELKRVLTPHTEEHAVHLKEPTRVDWHVGVRKGDKLCVCARQACLESTSFDLTNRSWHFLPHPSGIGRRGQPSANHQRN